MVKSVKVQASRAEDQELFGKPDYQTTDLRKLTLVAFYLAWPSVLPEQGKDWLAQYQGNVTEWVNRVTVLIAWSPSWAAL